MKANVRGGQARRCLIVSSLAALLLFATSASAGILPIGVEKDLWSDLAFPSGVSGGFDSGTMELTSTASPSNALDIGLGTAIDYGSGGALGGAFSATLNVSGVLLQADGTVNNGGSVTVIYNGGVPNTFPGLALDYGLTGGETLLTGTVLEVLMDATGADTLDIAFSISGGVLQTNNPTLGVPFSPVNLGIIRVSAPGGLPADFSTSFSFDSSTTINVLGVPEPSSIALGMLGVILMSMARSRSKRCHFLGECI